MTDERDKLAATQGADPWASLPEGWESGSRFDGKDAGCGQLLINMKIHFDGLAPGLRVAVRTSDPGAPMDIPAWCRSTGHALVEARHPYYLVAVREDRAQ